MRGARTARAAASTTESSASSISAARRCATCTSAAARTPASLNSSSSPGRAAGEADVEAVALVDRGHALAPTVEGSGRAPVEHVAQRLDERGRRLPGEHAARHAVDDRRVRPGHPAHEQVQHAREVALGGVARQPPAQVAVQRDGVEQRLEAVVRVGHLGAERGRAVVPGGQVLARQREPVGLVVDDGEALAGEPQDEVDAAREVAAHARAQARVEQALRVARQRVARRRVRAHHVGDRGQRQRRAARVVAADQRQLEVELVEPVGARDVAQRDAARHRPQRRLDRRAQARDDAREVAELDPPPRLRGGDLLDQLQVEIRRREVRRLEDAVDQRPDLDPDRHVGEQRRHRSQRIGAVVLDRRRVRRGLVVDDGLLRLARHPRLVGAGGDVAERGPPPPPVQLAVERGRRQLRRRGHVARPGDGRARAPTARRCTPVPLASSWNRSVAASSVGTAAPDDATFPSPSRANSSRLQRRVAAAHEPAHHTTAWCFARVSATYASRRSSPRCSSTCCLHVRRSTAGRRGRRRSSASRRRRGR